jgi:hypothetical protein
MPEKFVIRELLIERNGKRRMSKRNFKKPLLQFETVTKLDKSGKASGRRKNPSRCPVISFVFWRYIHLISLVLIRYINKTRMKMRNRLDMLVYFL